MTGIACINLNIDKNGERNASKDKIKTLAKGVIPSFFTKTIEIKIKNALIMASNAPRSGSLGITHRNIRAPSKCKRSFILILQLGGQYI